MSDVSASEPGRHLACTITLGIIRRVRSVAGEASLASCSRPRTAPARSTTSKTSPTGSPATRRWPSSKPRRRSPATPSSRDMSAKTRAPVQRHARRHDPALAGLGRGDAAPDRRGGHEVLGRLHDGGGRGEPRACACSSVARARASRPTARSANGPTACSRARPSSTASRRRRWRRSSARAAAMRSASSPSPGTGSSPLRTADPAEHITVLEAEIAALNESLESMYAVAGDLIADDDLNPRSPRSRSARRARCARLITCSWSSPISKDEPEIYSRGLSEEDAQRLAEEVLSVEPSRGRRALADGRHPLAHGASTAASWRSSTSPQSFFLRERRTLEHYARYAANALDLSVALAEARRGHAETQALLDFARSLAGAPRKQVAGAPGRGDPAPGRLRPRGGVPGGRCRGHLRCAATHGYPADARRAAAGPRDHPWARPTRSSARELFALQTPHALFFGRDSASPFVQEMFGHLRLDKRSRSCRSSRAARCSGRSGSP